MLPRSSSLLGALGAAALLAVAAVVMLSGREAEFSQQPASTELLLKVDLEPHEPYSPPPNMYLWWGPSTNHRFVGSGEHIRHLLHLGQIEGGEWRDPMFLGNNGVATFRSSKFHFRFSLLPLLFQSYFLSSISDTPPPSCRCTARQTVAALQDRL